MLSLSPFVFVLDMFSTSDLMFQLTEKNLKTDIPFWNVKMGRNKKPLSSLLSLSQLSHFGINRTTDFITEGTYFTEHSTDFGGVSVEEFSATGINNL